MDFSGFLTVYSSEMVFRVHLEHILMHFSVPMTLKSILKFSKKSRIQTSRIKLAEKAFVVNCSLKQWGQFEISRRFAVLGCPNNHLNIAE